MAYMIKGTPDSAAEDRESWRGTADPAQLHGSLKRALRHMALLFEAL